MIFLPPNSLFLAGVPATGKSYFGNWLEKNYNYLHLDVEKYESARQHGLEREILHFYAGNYYGLLGKLSQANRPVVFNWGFPPEALKIAQIFIHSGLSPVWFSANSQIARRKYIERNNVSEVHFYDLQVSKIKRNKEDLYSAFGGCIIKTIFDNGSRLDAEAIFKQIRENLDKQNSLHSTVKNADQRSSTPSDRITRESAQIHSEFLP